MFLSKSLYLNGLQCKKYLWLKIHNEKKLQKPDASQEAIFKTGNEVSEKVCELFPGGKKIKYDKTVSHSERIAQTKKYIEDGVKTIFEATFEFDGVLVMVDILNVDKDGNYEIYEVKSSTWHSKKKLKEIKKYINDISIQYYVLKGCGLKVSKACVTLINSDYIRDVKEDLNKLFIHKDMTKEVIALQSKIPRKLKSFYSVLEQDKVEPDVDIGHHCKNPYDCPGTEYCWVDQRGIPEYSVFNIFKLRKKSKALDLYRKGIVNIHDIPQSEKLTKKQKKDVDLVKNNEVFIDEKKITSFFKSLNHPLYFFDFETYQQVLPEYPGISPYMQIPFQYSLHIVNRDAPIDHKEFLADHKSDPRKSLVERLILHIPANVTVIAYNASFEIAVLKKLVIQFPEHKKHLESVIYNTMDLAEIFKNKYYYHPKMNGKYSIKKVLGILVPEMEKAYKELDNISKGSDAMQAFPSLRENNDQEEVAKIRGQLKEYCKLDTQAMVDIYKKLVTIVKYK
ncbi:DUF2779 domain-containing protein [Gammaproteobacteria bacterium]|nr:DUF2779 domain-containing protein [Gammaproteobacteria bacterium]